MPTKIASTPYFLPILRSAIASSSRLPTAASSDSRLPSATMRVPGCAACTCDSNSRVACALIVASESDANSTSPNLL